MIIAGYSPNIQWNEISQKNRNRLDKLCRSCHGNKNQRLSPLSLYRSPDNRMILKQISKGDNHYLKKQQPSCMEVGLSDTILKGTHPGTIYAKFGSIWPSCFRGEDFFNISQLEKRIILGGHVYRPNGTKWRNFIEDLTQMLTTKFGSIWPSCFRGED